MNLESKRPPSDATPELWLTEHGDLLFRFAILRVNDQHLAEDLVQETFVKAVASFSKFRHESSVRTWLFQILRNEISNHFRKTKRARALSDTATDPSSLSLDQLLAPQLENSEFATSIERDEFWVAVERCFAQIPDHLLETFLLRLANPAEKIEELCKQLDLQASNFSVRVFRTRLMLRQCLENSWLSELDP